MQIFIETPSATTTGDLIIPVVQSDALADQLAEIGQQLNLSPAVLQRDFAADANELLPVYRPDGQRTFLLGLGTDPQPMVWLRILRKLFFDHRKKLSNQISVDLSAFDGLIIEPVVLGILGGGYDLGLYKTDKTDAPAFYGNDGKLTLHIRADQQQTAQDALTRAEAIAHTQRDMLDLMNAPANYKTPQTLADRAVESGKRHGYTVTVLDKTELERQGLGALLSVSRGSDVPPVQLSQAEFALLNDLRGIVVRNLERRGAEAVNTSAATGA